LRERLLFLLALLALTPALGACGSTDTSSANVGGAESPAEAVEVFAQAAGNGRFDDACRLVSPTVRAGIGFVPQAEESLEGCMRGMQIFIYYTEASGYEPPSGFTADGGERTIEGNTALVETTIDYDGTPDPAAAGHNGGNNCNWAGLDAERSLDHLRGLRRHDLAHSPRRQGPRTDRRPARESRNPAPPLVAGRQAPGLYRDKARRIGLIAV
jgi:hypothetical protein